MIWQCLTRGTTVTLPFDHGEHRGGGLLNRFVSAANLLPAALLATAIVLLAQPVRSDQPTTRRKLTNIEFVLDVSGSMTSDFGDASCYDGAMNAINGFIGFRKGDAFGLTIFGNEVLRWTPLTQDVTAIKSATPFLRPENLPGHFGGTEIGNAIEFTMKTLVDRGSDGDRMIVLVSDGESADLYDNRSVEISQQLAGQQIVLYAIHIGESNTPQDLYSLSLPTGGEVFRADNPTALRSVFERIDKMRPVQLEPVASTKVNASLPIAFAGLVLSGMLLMAAFGWRFMPW